MSHNPTIVFALSQFFAIPLSLTHTTALSPSQALRCLTPTWPIYLPSYHHISFFDLLLSMLPNSRVSRYVFTPRSKAQLKSAVDSCLKSSRDSACYDLFPLSQSLTIYISLFLSHTIASLSLNCNLSLSLSLSHTITLYIYIYRSHTIARSLSLTTALSHNSSLTL